MLIYWNVKIADEEITIQKRFQSGDIEDNIEPNDAFQSVSCKQLFEFFVYFVNNNLVFWGIFQKNCIKNSRKKANKEYDYSNFVERV